MVALVAVVCKMFRMVNIVAEYRISTYSSDSIELALSKSQFQAILCGLISGLLYYPYNYSWAETRQDESDYFPRARKALPDTCLFIYAAGEMI